MAYRHLTTSHMVNCSLMRLGVGMGAALTPPPLWLEEIKVHLIDARDVTVPFSTAYYRCIPLPEDWERRFTVAVGNGGTCH
jgi:hypothetical protein